MSSGTNGIFEYLTLQRLTSAEKYLKFLDYIADFFGFGVFFSVFFTRFQKTVDWRQVIDGKVDFASITPAVVMPFVLLLLFGIIYFFSRHSVKMELEIGPLLFPRDRIPKNWGGSGGKVIQLLRVIAFLAVYVVLAWSVDNIIVASFLMLLIASNDWITRFNIGEGIRKYFSDGRYAPSLQDRDCKVIEQRREVAVKFLFKRPHLFKETLRALGCAAALGIAIFGYARRDAQFELLAYYVLIAVLVLNELVTQRWRYKMFTQMNAIGDW